MPHKEIFSKFALIGENLDLKENIHLEIDKDGKFSKINYEDPKRNIRISEEGHNFLMIPGLINSHVHIVDNFAKEMGFNKDLIEIVAPPNGLKHKLLNSTPNRVKKNGILQAVVEMLSNGITCFIDFREGGVEGVNFLRDILKDSPIHPLIYGRFMNIDEIEKVFNIADGIGLASYKMSSLIDKDRVRYYKNQNKIPVSCHHAEVKRDEDILNEIVSDNLIDIIIHGTQFTVEDLKLIKSKNIALVLCPRSNGYFGVGFPPINDILRLKIPISLGTDNLMVNSTDLFEELRYLYRISRVLGGTHSNIELDAKEMLKMITINAARNFKLDKIMGSIEIGKSADFSLIDLNHPNFFSFEIELNNISSLIVQRTKSENIKKTYIKGDLAFERN